MDEYNGYLPGQFLYCTESYLFTQYIFANKEYAYITQPNKCLSKTQLYAEIDPNLLATSNIEYIKRILFAPEIKKMFIVQVPLEISDDKQSFFYSDSLIGLPTDNIERFTHPSVISSQSFYDLYSEGEWKTWRHFTKKYGKGKRVQIRANQYGRNDFQTWLIDIMFLIYSNDTPLGQPRSDYNHLKTEKSTHENIEIKHGKYAWREKLKTTFGTDSKIQQTSHP